MFLVLGQVITPVTSNGAQGRSNGYAGSGKQLNGIVFPIELGRGLGWRGNLYGWTAARGVKSS